jgi:hypothetical protein
MHPTQIIKKMVVSIDSSGMCFLMDYLVLFKFIRSQKRLDSVEKEVPD